MRVVYVIFFILLVCLVILVINTKDVTIPIIIGGYKKRSASKRGVATTNSSMKKINSLSSYKNILIVDVANVFIGWYMEKYSSVGNLPVPYMKQSERIRKYLECATDHYKQFRKYNPEAAVNYVIKNFRHTHAIGKSDYNYMPKLSVKDWDICHEFVRKHKNAIISIAIDYRVVPSHKWKDKSQHYLRGRDDYLCFKLAQLYKKNFINHTIMSDDKFRDFTQFGFIPDFCAYYIRNINGNVIQNDEMIKPRPNSLGQIRDYKMVKITTEFDFANPKFIKTSDYGIAKPGEVWNNVFK